MAPQPQFLQQALLCPTITLRTDLAAAHKQQTCAFLAMQRSGSKWQQSIKEKARDRRQPFCAPNLMSRGYDVAGNLLMKSKGKQQQRRLRRKIAEQSGY